MSNIIHQLYATHCTYGSSAIERRTSGESKDRVLGYSARASSFSQSELRRHFRTIERFLYYYLPKETPPDRKQKLAPQDAPHRLFFTPSMSGLQALGYISYRKTDCAGRVGSYFAHVLTSEIKPAETPWDVIECLKLWNASGWMIEDSETFKYELPPATSLAALRNGKPAAVDERVLWSFLNTPPEPRGKFYTPDPTVIPERWRQMSVEDRRKRFRQALMGYLEIADQPRESLLILAEPAVAVLFFYGIARLLPPPLRKSISFSTFETNADRLVTSLAAFTFDNERAGGDVPPERYRRGFVVNTWEYKASELRAPQAKYADFVLGSLVNVPEKDAPTLARSIDDKLAHFQGCDLTRTGDLEDVVQAKTVSEQVLNLTPGVDHAAWDKLPAQRAFVRKAVRQKLAGAADPAYLDRVLKSPGEYLPLLLEIAVQGEGNDNCTTAVAYLVERMPLGDLDKLLGAGDVARGYKLHALRHYVARHNQLPGDCDWFWKEQPTQGSTKPPVAFDLFQSSCVTPQLIKSQLDSVPDAGLNLLFRSVLRAPMHADERQDILGRIAGRPQFDVTALMPDLQPEITAQGPLLKTILAPSLRQALNDLHRKPARFAQAVKGLDAALPLLEDELASRAKAWGRLRAILDIAKNEKQSQPGVRIKGKSQEFTQKLCRQLDQCFSRYDADCEAVRNNHSEIGTFVDALTREYGLADLLTKDYFRQISQTFRGLATPTSRAAAPARKGQPGAGNTWLKEHGRTVLRAAGAVALIAFAVAVLVVGNKVIKLLPSGRTTGETPVAEGPKTNPPPADNTGEPQEQPGEQETQPGQQPEAAPQPAGSSTQAASPSGASPAPAQQTAPSPAQPAKESKPKPPPEPPPKPTPPAYPVAEAPERDVVVVPGNEHVFELAKIEANVSDFTLHLHGCESLKDKYPSGSETVEIVDARAERPTVKDREKGLDVRVKARGTDVTAAKLDVASNRLIQLEIKTSDTPYLAEAQRRLRFCVLEILDNKAGVPRYIALQQPRQVAEGFPFAPPDLTKMRSEATLKLEPGDAPPGDAKFYLGSGRLKCGDRDTNFGADAPTQPPSDTWALADFMQQNRLSGYGEAGLKSVNMVCSQRGAESLVVAVQTEPEFVPDARFQEVSKKLAKLDEWEGRLPGPSATMARLNTLKPNLNMNPEEKEIAACMTFLEEQGKKTPEQKFKWAQEAAEVLGLTLPEGDPSKGPFALWVSRSLHRRAVEPQRNKLRDELDAIGNSEKAKLQRSLKMALESLTSVEANVYRTVPVPDRRKDAKGTVPVRVLVIAK